MGRNRGKNRLIPKSALFCYVGLVLFLISCTDGNETVPIIEFPTDSDSEWDSGQMDANGDIPDSETVGISTDVNDSVDTEYTDTAETDPEPMDTDVFDSFCDSYPSADNDFHVGSVIRNYLFYDPNDNPTYLCELVGTGNRLLLLTVAGYW